MTGEFINLEPAGRRDSRRVSPRVLWGWIGATAASVLAIGWVVVHQLEELAMRVAREGRAQRDLPKNDREMARIYKLFADQGNADREINLGFFYENSLGGQKRTTMRRYFSTSAPLSGGMTSP